MPNNFNVSFTIGAVLAGSMAATFNAAQKYLNQAQNSTKQLSQKQQELQAKQQALNQAVSQGVINLQTYQKAMQQVAVQSQQLQAAQGKLKFDELGEKRQSAMSDAMKWGAATYAMAEPIRDAMKFESAMSDVRKVVDMTGDEFKGMGMDILNMTDRLPMTAEEISKIVAAGGQAGIDKSELLEFADSAAKMGVAFDITADQAGDMMASWRTAFKMGQTDVIELADKINYLGNTTSASADKVSDVVTKIGPLGEVGGVASGEIAALGASMVAASVQSDVAATGIKNLILGMTAGEGATGAQSAAFTKLGLDATEMAQKMQKDAKGAILEVLDSLKGLDKAEQANVLKDLFGKESIGAIAPLLSNLDALKDNFDKVADSSNYAGSMQKEFEEKCKTTEFGVKMVRNAATKLSVILGASLLPAIGSMAEGLTGVVSAVTNFVTKYPAVGTAIYGIALGFTAIMTAVSIARVAIFAGQQAVTAFRIAQSLFNATLIAGRAVMGTMTLAQWALNAAMTANPIGLVIAGIAALIAVGVVLYNYWDEISAFFAAMWESPGAAILIFLTGPVGWLIAAGIWVVQNWETVKQWFTTLWENPHQALMEFIEGVRSKFGALIDWLGGKWEWLKGLFSSPIKASVEASASGNGESQSIEANATGGIYKQGAFLTTFAEESPEAAIPIDGSARAISLWKQTGAMLGMNVQDGENQSGRLSGFSNLAQRFSDSPATGSTSNSAVNVTFAPTIEVQGNGDANAIGQVVRGEMERLKSMLEELQNNGRRKSFA